MTLLGPAFDEKSHLQSLQAEEASFWCPFLYGWGKKNPKKLTHGIDRTLVTHWLSDDRASYLPDSLGDKGGQKKKVCFSPA